jgi:large subunit ribosomal protein L22
MKASGTLSYIKVSPQKARLVVDQIRGKKAGEAVQILSFSRKAVAKPLLKLLKSVISNAAHKEIEETDNLVIRKATVDMGPMMKRFQPMPMGRAGRILKRTSIITLELD